MVVMSRFKSFQEPKPSKPSDKPKIKKSPKKKQVYDIPISPGKLLVTSANFLLVLLVSLRL